MTCCAIAFPINAVTKTNKVNILFIFLEVKDVIND